MAFFVLMASLAAGDIVGHLPDPVARAATELVPQSIHVPSFIAGFGAALLLALIAAMVVGKAPRLLIMLVGAVAMIGLGAGYLTFMRAVVGSASNGIATPQTVIDDARAAANAMQKQIEKRGAALEQLEEKR